MSYWILEKKGEPASMGATASHKSSFSGVQTTLHGYAKPGPGSVAVDDAANLKSNRTKRKRSAQDIEEKTGVVDSGVDDEIQVTQQVSNAASIGVSLYSSDESSVSGMERTPPKRSIKRRRKRWGDAACAPAISPKKRKSLIEQSAKDIAAQQHRQRSSRSSRKPLLSIENITETTQNLSQASQRERSVSEATPSPLRKGFSIVHVNAFSDAESEEDGQRSPLLNRSSSPIAFKTLTIAAPDELPRRRILARETQLPDFTLRDDEEKDPESLHERQSPIEEASTFDSSQTVPETAYESEEELSDPTSERNLVIVEHVMSPCSEADGDVTIMPEASVHFEGRAADVDDQHTQPLPWDDEEVAEGEVAVARPQTENTSPDEAISPLRTQRRNQSWINIDHLWSGHLGDDTGSKTRMRRAAAKQSTLQLHGFSKHAARRPAARSPSPLSEGEDVPSDIEEDADGMLVPTPLRPTSTTLDRLVVDRADVQMTNNHGVADLVDDTTYSSETQSLPWDDEKSNSSQGMDQTINIPSDSGLDTQMRHFFAQL